MLRSFHTRSRASAAADAFSSLYAIATAEFVHIIVYYAWLTRRNPYAYESLVLWCWDDCSYSGVFVMVLLQRYDVVRMLRWRCGDLRRRLWRVCVCVSCNYTIYTYYVCVVCLWFLCLNFVRVYAW